MRLRLPAEGSPALDRFDLLAWDVDAHALCLPGDMLIKAQALKVGKEHRCKHQDLDGNRCLSQKLRLLVMRGALADFDMSALSLPRRQACKALHQPWIIELRHGDWSYR